MANPVKIKATVREVIRHTDDVASYRFEPHGRVPKFHAGQFLHLALDKYIPQARWPESRVFSIASSPSERRLELAVTMSVKGRYTRRIIDELDEGSECWLKLPYGSFIFPHDTELSLIAGGVGITPYVSLFKQMLEDRSAQSVRLYYGIRSQAHYLFADLLADCGQTLPGFSMVLYSEDNMPRARTGIPDIQAIAQEGSADTKYYLSGPPAMIENFKSGLLKSDIPADRIFVDDWQ